MKEKVLVAVGSWSDGIRMAPVIRAMERGETLQPVLVSSGEQRQLLDEALDVFGLKPDAELEGRRPGQTLEDMTAQAVQGMRRILQRRRPSWVLVHGDTTTALAAALAAFYEKVPVGHVEAGLRSDERYLPRSEVLNRKLMDRLSALLFAPTEHAACLLRAEGFRERQVYVTGNTVVEALVGVRGVANARGGSVPGLDGAVLAGRRMILVTLYRRESSRGTLEGVCQALRRIARDNPDVVLVHPLPRDPCAHEPMRRLLGGEERLVLLPPVDGLELVALMERASLLLTDSGRVQEEAPAFGKPVLVLREVTDRPEGVFAGVSRLVGTSPESIYEETVALLRDPPRLERMAGGANPYGDGHASERIVHLLAAQLLEWHPAPAGAVA
jgi:UDP-N-acetylglucosamine 2-epimerase (non-hydrolysing)